MPFFGGGGGNSAVTSVAGRTGAVILSTPDIGGLGSAALASSTDFDSCSSEQKTDRSLCAR